MISLIKEIIDRIIQLISHRIKVKHELFDRFVEEVYRKAESVTQDLLEFYTEVINTLIASNYQQYNKKQEQEFIQSIRNKRAHLEEMRRKMLSLRLELKAACDQIKISPIFNNEEYDEVIADMLNSILFILRDPNMGPLASRPQNLLDSIDMFINPVDESTDWRDARWFIGSVVGGVRELVKNTEKAWGDVSQEYQKIKLLVYK